MTLSARIAQATEGSADLDRDLLILAGWKPHHETQAYWISPHKVGLVYIKELPLPTQDWSDLIALIEARGWEWFKNSEEWIMKSNGTLVPEIVYEIWDGARHHSAQRPDNNGILALATAFARALEAQKT